MLSMGILHSYPGVAYLTVRQATPGTGDKHSDRHICYVMPGKKKQTIFFAAVSHCKKVKN